MQACLDTDPWTGKHFPNQNRTADVLPALHYLRQKAELKVPGLASPGAPTHLSIFPLFFKALHVYNKALLLCNQPCEIRRESVGVIQQPGSVTCTKRAKQSPVMFHETLPPTGSELWQDSEQFWRT